MNTTRIQNTLETLFQDSARWLHPGRRVVFWYDPEQQFTSSFNELQLEGVEKLQLADTAFTVKYHLLVEQPTQAFLLYAPFPEPAPQENWLLDIQKSGLTFSADPAALIYADLGLRSRRLEIVIREHDKFFKSRKRTEALQAMGISPDSDERGLLLAMLSVLAGLKVPDAGTLIRRVLLGGLLESDNVLWSDIERFISPEAFWEVVQEHTDFPKQNPSLNKLFVQLLITHFAKSLHGTIPPQLANQVITPGQRAYAFIDQWMRDQQDSLGWKILSSEVAEQLHIFDAIENLEPEVLFEAASFEVVDKVLIRTCVKTLQMQMRQQITELTPWRTWLQARHTLIWFPQYEKIYQALEAAIALLEFKQQYPEGFRQPAPLLFKAYASDLHSFDQAYRHFIVKSDDAQGDILKGLIDDVENLYTQWFLDSLGEAWSDALSEEGKGEKGKILPPASSPLPLSWELEGIASQTRFFGRHVFPILERSDREKVFVIISDALRYEVASELQEVIKKEVRGETSLEAQLGVLPSVTRLGMAALLPGSKLELIPSDDDVRLDGLSTKGALARQKVLNQNSRVEATVLSAKDLLEMNTDEGRAAVQPYRLIYIYHNVIDAIGDQASSERQVLSACKTAISELLRLVKKICNSINGTNVIITADHGFLYQRRPIQEADKQPLPSGEAVLESKRRYLLAREQLNDSTLLHFSLPYTENGTVAIVPRGSLRFAVQGVGAQFVHGGASLQEVCVPVITYHHQRAVKGDEGPARKVGVQVSARVRRVTNNRFTLTLVQSDAVEGRWRSRQITVAFYDPQTNTPITDVRGANLSSTSPHPSDREINLRLTVTTANPPSNVYLIVKDADDESELLRETWAVSLGIANDFGDF
ncbi:BREX-1 system phosphatase PglZ type A [Nostoc sp. ChiQUE01b]|uniref:BREX-1 system phosphatase PglZ type A n=1 Tax=Nostoc sp. ChiQUE01b TaxID=3075376 RepID=UPI002AD36086|nr:BREX-1 system phosphatase PglZ type A [Nostoc sp. ChiQUE01b]MDZ8259431.1 BREX-1 system phosphatase PglZ type A [Nostoc sp. ChiQUE01b]